MMVGHIAVPHLDQAHPQRPASLSPVMVHEYLRNRWGYKGVIISDDIAVAATATEGDVEKAAVLALAAGCDALLLEDSSPERIRAICAAVDAAVAEGVLSREALNESKRRLDGLQAWLKNPTGLPGEVPKLETGGAALAEAETEAAAPAEPGKPAEAEKPAREETAVKETKPEPAETAPETPKIVEEPAEAKSEGPKPAEEVAEATPETPKPAPEAAQPAPTTDKPVYHVVKRGDTLTRLSVKYGASIEDLKAWNNLEGEKILLDQKLRVSPPGTNETE